MKKMIVFLWVCLLAGMSVGFAEGLPPYNPVEIDERAELIVESPGDYYGGNRFEGVTFLKNGGIAYQVAKTTINAKANGEDTIETKLHLFSGKVGGHFYEKSYSYAMNLEGFDPSFVVEDKDEILYFKEGTEIYAIDSKLQGEKQRVLSERMGNYLVKSKGDSILYFERPEMSEDDVRKVTDSRLLNIAKAREGQKISEGLDICYASMDEMSLAMTGAIGKILAVDFAETEEAIYALVDTVGGDKLLQAKNSSGPEEMRYQIVRLEMTFDRKLNTIDFTETNRIQIQESFDSSAYLGMQFNGMDFVFSSYQITEEGLSTSMMRVDASGKVYDTILFPGLVYNFDVKGDLTLAAVLSPFEQDQGLYLIDWNKREAQGGPRALIAERTMNGKTMAIFRDQGYGLLRKEESETGVIDYLAPLKTEEKDVALRIPLCDVTAKLAEDVRYLEIMLGEDRIDISMDSLDVRDLLSQLPCETDATIEIRLTRDEEGNIAVSADLFVIEQVNEMTKVVHRVPIALP